MFGMSDSEKIAALANFIKECSTFRYKLKHISLSDEQWHAVKLKLYDLIFEIEARTQRPPEQDSPPRDLSQPK